MRNNYGLYFQKDNTIVRLPVNPDKYMIENPTDNTRYNVLDLGEIIVARIPALKIISWDGYFPNDYNDPFSVGDVKKPEFYIRFFEKCQDDLKPARFIVNRFLENGGKLFDTNMDVIVEKFDITEKGGETGDFRYSLKLSQYRNFSPKTVTIKPTVTAASAASGATASDSPTVAVATTQRAVADDVFNVNDAVIANGNYWYSSWGDKPFGTANNLRTTITRIVKNPN
ncbi:MAG: hypothetical protein FWF82_07525, partial [Oscillospiraceae bacterium]|nr:hypothetical protein [Oscillospiraceae bacterium]